MKKNDFLKALPIDLANKIQIAEADDAYKVSAERFDSMLASATDALLTLATISWEEAATSEEKEDAIRASTIVLTLLQQVTAVLGHVVPPGPRKIVYDIMVKGVSSELRRYDGVLRQNLPAGAKTRADYIAAQRAKEPVTE